MLECDCVKIVRCNATAVVLDFDRVQSPSFESNVDGGCAGIYAVLDKLLDDRTQIYDDLARLDLVNLR